jgi:hypothetical protein
MAPLLENLLQATEPEGVAQTGEIPSPYLVRTPKSRSCNQDLNHVHL